MSDFKPFVVVAVMIIGVLLGSGLTLFIVNSNISSEILTSGGSRQVAAVQSTLPQNEQIENNQPNAVSAKNIVDDDPFIGPKNAEIVIVEFSDFECPFCGAADGTNQQVMDYLKSKDPEWEAPVPKLRELANQGKIKLVYRDFPLSGHPNSQKASEASQCANEQNKFWEYHDLLFKNQESLEIQNLKKYAGQLNLNQQQFDSCLDSGKYATEVKKDFQEGSKLGVSGTPAFFVNDKLLSGAYSYSAFKSIIGI